MALWRWLVLWWAAAVWWAAVVCWVAVWWVAELCWMALCSTVCRAKAASWWAGLAGGFTISAPATVS